MQTLARSIVVIVALLAGCEAPVASPPPPTPVAVALFDPLASPPVVPTPNDLAFVGGDGTHLNVPDQPTDSPAQRALNAYLRQLNGFPGSTTATASFSAPLDPATVTLTTPAAPGAIVLLDTTTFALVGPTAVTPSLSADGQTLSLTPTPPQFLAGHRYAVLLFGGTDAAGLRGAAGEQVVAAPTFFFLRSPNPLVGRCGDAANPDCACPSTALADPTDTTCHSLVLGLSDAAARQAEPQRIQLQTALMTLLPTVAPGRDQNNLVLFWTFTISTQPFTVFDTASGNIPFPNDALIDQTTGRVNLPIAAGDPMAPLKMALDTLDGFSVSAPETIGVTGPAPIDTKTLVPSRSVLFLNVTPTAMPPQPEFSVTTAFNQIVLVPTLPLASDQSRYAVVVTNGVSDTSGQALLPAAAVWLSTGPDPLFDGTHSTVSALSDTQAQQLEALRLAEQPLVQQLAALGIARQAIAGLWTFTTQSITRPNAALDAFPAQATLPTDVTLTKVADQVALAAAFGVQNFLTHVKYLVIGTFTSRAVVDPTTGLIGFTRSTSGGFTVAPPATAATTTIHFWLALPNATGAVPIAIVQHGLGSWRGDVLPLADALAQQGWASIAFDIDFHGARSKCTADNQCLSGACNLATGACPGGFVPTPASSDTLACDLAAVTADTNDCRPTISGQNYVNPSNLFTGRSNGQQYIVDAAQLVRILGDATNANGLAAKLAGQTIPVTPTIDVAKLGFLGQSLGAIDGALFVAAAPEPRVGVLNVGGGHLFDLLSASPAFMPLIDQFLASIGVARGTAAYAQLAATAAWVLDPADPWSVAPSLRPKPVIVQEAGMDMVILPPFEEALAQAIFGASGLDAAHHAQGRQSSNGALVSTYFPTAAHGELLSGSPVGVAMVTQAIGFLASFGALLPAP
ncbi:MAG: putative lipoprotein [bacterium]|nr:putative lipoprotein [bacterium]